jgi:DNA-binding CsgD family transcriptional regulator
MVVSSWPGPARSSTPRYVADAAEGLSNPQIAQALFVTRRTVETHLRHAYQKLAIDSREELSQVLRPSVP